MVASDGLLSPDVLLPLGCLVGAVLSLAFLMVFERFVFRYVTMLPPTITEAEYGVYALQAVAVIVTFCTGIVLVPSLTTAIFSGQGGQAFFPGLNRFLRR